MTQSVVVLEQDPGVARSLAGGLRPHFSVHLPQSREEVREDMARKRPQAVVLNIEGWHLTEVESLHRDFPALPIVCTHRIPDEEMWMAALEAGASDVCPAGDVANVLTSLLRSTALSRSAAENISLPRGRPTGVLIFCCPNTLAAADCHIRGLVILTASCSRRL